MADPTGAPIRLFNSVTVLNSATTDRHYGSRRSLIPEHGGCFRLHRISIIAFRRNERLIVPDDVMVVTHMNRGYRPPYPVPVVGVQVDPHGIAREMVALLEALLRGERTQRKIVLVEPALVVPPSE